MRKVFCLIFAVIIAILAVGCTKDEETVTHIAEDSTTSDTKTASKAKFDIDLTSLSSTVVYSEVYNMVSEPDEYMGKSIRIKGNFSVYIDETTGNIYFACIIPDATACCSQGLEFITKEELKYPDDYPDEGSEITVSGIFETYTEGKYMYYRLKDAEIEKVK